jgi:hypothetical protein
MVEQKKQKTHSSTTQRVDMETLAALKTLNYHIFKGKGIRISQSEVISKALLFALSRENEFIDYLTDAKTKSKEGTFDMLVRVTSKPWFPYGDAFKID